MAKKKTVSDGTEPVELPGFYGGGNALVVPVFNIRALVTPPSDFHSKILLLTPPGKV